MPAEQGLWLEDDRCVDQGREQPVEADEDQTICSLQPRSDRRRPLQDNELLAQVEDLSFASGLRATQPRQQRRKKSLNTDHSAKSLTDWKAVDRLDKFFGRDRRNEVTLRSLELFMAHETFGYVDKIGPVPLLMIVEDADTLGAVDQSLDIYNRAHEPKKLVMLHGGHFDAYVRDQAVTARAASEWYVDHLIKDPMN